MPHVRNSQGKGNTGSSNTTGGCGCFGGSDKSSTKRGSTKKTTRGK